MEEKKRIYTYSQKQRRLHNKLFPDCFRSLIVGPSGCGKTQLLMRMLLEDGLLNYDKLYIYTPSLFLKEYQCLEHGFNHNLHKDDIYELLKSDDFQQKEEINIRDMAKLLQLYNEKHGVEPTNIEVILSKNPEEIPPPDQLDRNFNHLMIFDDTMTMKNQQLEEDYYTRSRANNCDCFYLAQDYFTLPLHTVRRNSNFLIFFRVNPRVMKEIYDIHFDDSELDFKKFKKFCHDAWKPKHGYVVIDMSKDYESGDKLRSSLLRF
jgi:hypothetical protein